MHKYGCSGRGTVNRTQSSRTAGTCRARSRSHVPKCKSEQCTSACFGPTELAEPGRQGVKGRRPQTVHQEPATWYVLYSIWTVAAAIGSSSSGNSNSAGGWGLVVDLLLTLCLQTLSLCSPLLSTRLGLKNLGYIPLLLLRLLFRLPSASVCYTNMRFSGLETATLVIY